MCTKKNISRLHWFGLGRSSWEITLSLSFQLTEWHVWLRCMVLIVVGSVDQVVLCTFQSDVLSRMLQQWSPVYQAGSQTLSLRMLTKCSVCQWGMCVFESWCSCLWNALGGSLQFKFFFKNFPFSNTRQTWWTSRSDTCVNLLLFLYRRRNYDEWILRDLYSAT